MIMLSGYFCASLHVGHARSIRLVLTDRIIYLEDNGTNVMKIVLPFILLSNQSVSLTIPKK